MAIRLRLVLVVAAGLGGGFLLSGCDGVGVEAPGGPMSSDLVVVQVDRGYGADANGNGVIDIPNSVEYVQRPLRVALDASPAGLFFPSIWPIPEDGNAGLGDLEGPWRWTFTAQDVRQDAATLPAPSATHPGATGVNDGGSLVTYTQRPELELAMFEGDWELEFARVQEDNLEEAIYWKTVNLRVEDWLIVQLGDSYSSGEGNPEVSPDPSGIWADDGSDAYATLPDYDKCLPLSFDATHVRCVREESFGTRPNRRHEVAHRSSKSWGSLLALDVEERDISTSVTYVNLAATGARLEHLTRWQRIDDVPLVVPRDFDTLVGSGTTAAAYRFFLTRELKEELPPQLDQLQELVGQREVDAVLMSFGGNDVGFGYAVTSYVIRDAGDNDYLRQIDDAVKDGDWSELDDFNSILVAAGLVPNFNFPSNLPGMNGLPAQYQAAGEALRDAGIPAENVYITEYPDPLVAETDTEKGSHGDDEVEVCPGPILTAVSDGRQIGRLEQRHARGALLHPLNSRVAEAARTHGWNLVGQVMDSMYGRPICDSQRMVLRYNESRETQGDRLGTLHPNLDGHTAIAARAGEHIHIRNTWRDLSEYEDRIDRTSARPQHRVYRVEDTTEQSDAGRDWRSVGLSSTSSRAHLSVHPSKCDWGGFAIDVAPAKDYVISGGSKVVVSPWKLDKPVVRLLREDSETDELSEVSRLDGYGTLSYVPEESDRGREFVLLATTPRNAATDPVRYARVHGGPTGADEYGTFDVRMRCTE